MFCQRNKPVSKCSSFISCFRTLPEQLPHDSWAKRDLCLSVQKQSKLYTEIVVEMAEREQLHDSFDFDTMNVVNIRSGFLLLVTLIYAQQTCLPDSFVRAHKKTSLTLEYSHICSQPWLNVPTFIHKEFVSVLWHWAFL